MVSLLLCLALLAVCPACTGRAASESRSPEKPYLSLFDLLNSARMTESGQVVPSGKGRRKARLLRIAGTRLPAVSAHPPSEFAFTVDIEPATRLRLHVALKPQAWEKRGDGTTFEVLVGTEFGRKKVLSFHLDPVSNPDHRRWYPLLVDLDRFQGSGREVILRTRPGPRTDPRYDWAMWGNPSLETAARLVPLDNGGLTHIFLISLDTLRKDHLNFFGHHRLTAPHLTRMLEECVLFSEAIAPSHWTMPSHMSVLTSLHPDVHRVVDPGGRKRLPSAIPMLTDLLAQNGYRTGGFSACGFLKGDLGFSRGFETYTLNSNDAEQQNQLTLDWLMSEKRRKSFVFLHYFDAHSDFEMNPYEASSGFDVLYPESVPQEVFSGCSPDGTLCASRYLQHLNTTRATLSSEELEAIRVEYDRGLRYLDYQLARLIARLKSLGVWESSLVVLFSDHGEEFQDHGRLLHAQLHQELLEVPLLIKLPGGAHGGVTVNEPVELLDIAPTILSVLGLPVPDLMQGRSMLPTIARAAGVQGWNEAGSGDTMSTFSWSAEGRSIRIGRWKLLSWREPGDNEIRVSLYDLETDPAELNDLSGTVPEVERWLNAQKREHVVRHNRLKQHLGPMEATPADSVGFSDRVRERLKMLGYLE